MSRIDDVLFTFRTKTEPRLFTEKLSTEVPYLIVPGGECLYLGYLLSDKLWEQGRAQTYLAGLPINFHRCFQTLLRTTVLGFLPVHSRRKQILSI